MHANRTHEAQIPIEVAFVVIPRFNMMALTTAIEPLRIANYLSQHPLYAWRFLSEAGGRVKASNDLDVATAALGTCQDGIDLAIACGSWGAEHYEAPGLFRWLRLMRRNGTRIASMDLGVYLLARAGLLSGHVVTTHWSCLAGFAERFPDIDMREQLYTVDDGLMTVGGGTAGIDLMLHLVAEQHGRQLAAEVADQMLHHPIRDAAMPQRRTLGGLKTETHPHIREAVALMETHLAEPLAMPDLAAAIGVSHRQLERLFHQHMGCSAIRFNLLLRLQSARVLLTSTSLSIREVSAASGFNSLSYFSQAFISAFGKRPREYRQAWPLDELQPTWPGTVFDYLEKSRERDKSLPDPAGPSGKGSGEARVARPAHRRSRERPV